MLSLRLLSLAFGIGIIAPSVYAQDQDRSKRHVMQEHVFLPTFAMPTAFTDTTTLLGVGVGTGDREGLELALISPRIEAQVSFLDNFSLSLAISGNIITGTNANSVLQYGASTGWNYRFGAVYRLLHDDRNVVALGLDMSKPRTVAVSPLDAAANAVRDLIGATSSEFISEKTVAQWRPTARWAHAFSPSIGLQSFAGFRMNQTREDAQSAITKNQFQIGLQIDADLKHATRIPVGIALNTVQSFLLRGEEDATGTQTYTFGIYETVEKHHTFNTGLEIGKTKTGEKSATIGAVVLRAYFN